jgi:hypothetical protein
MLTTRDGNVVIAESATFTTAPRETGGISHRLAELFTKS